MNRKQTLKQHEHCILSQGDKILLGPNLSDEVSSAHDQSWRYEASHLDAWYLVSGNNLKPTKRIHSTWTLNKTIYVPQC
jgi:hypothetical protein